jgi:protein ImuB
MAARVLVATCPYWPVLAAGISRDIPAAVVESNRVTVCSPGAFSQGIGIGMRLREAQSRYPSLLLVPPDPARDARGFEKVLLALENFTPFIEVLSSGTCLFPTVGCLRYFGSEQVLAELVLSTVSVTVGQQRCFGLGVADGLFAATLAARQSIGTGAPVITDPGASEGFLAPLKVSMLGRPELSDLLVRLGLKTLGDFARLPTVDVLSRFGPDGLVAHRLASGVDEHRFAPRVHQPDLECSEKLDPPADRVDIAVFVGKGLADRLALRLESEGLACNKVVIEATAEDGRQLSRTWRLEGGLSVGAIAERVRWQLEGWFLGSAGTSSIDGLATLRLIPEEITGGQGRQLSFWGGHTEPGSRAIRGVARLQGLLGPQSLVVPEFKSTGGGRGPGDMFRLVPADSADLLNRSVTPAFVKAAPWPGSIPAPSPALVLADRTRINLVDPAGNSLGVADEHLTAELARISIGGGQSAAITGWAGPWPVQERWWDPSARRELSRMQITCSDDCAYLVTFEEGRWWLEAIYD